MHWTRFPINGLCLNDHSLWPWRRSLSRMLRYIYNIGSKITIPIIAFKAHCCKFFFPFLSHITLDSIKVRFSGGGNLRGLVEVLYGSQWSYVCADHWTRAEADVTCRQLGFRGHYSPNYDRLLTKFLVVVVYVYIFS